MVGLWCGSNRSARNVSRAGARRGDIVQETQRDILPDQSTESRYDSGQHRRSRCDGRIRSLHSGILGELSEMGRRPFAVQDADEDRMLWCGESDGADEQRVGSGLPYPFRECTIHVRENAFDMGGDFVRSAAFV